MPGAALTDSLLKSACWHTEKRFRQHGNFPTVIWLTEDAAGRRQLFETDCDAPESVATDAQVLAALVEEMSQDFAAAGVVRFCVAYLCRRVTVFKPVDPDSPMKPTTTKKQGVVIELHSAAEHVSVFREILRPPRAKPILAAGDELEADTRGSPYAGMLQRAAAVSGVTLW